MSATMGRTAMETSDEFRLLVAEIAEQEGVSILEARARARELWAELGGVDPATPVPPPAVDWRFVAWCLFLALCAALALAGGLAWVLISA